MSKNPNSRIWERDEARVGGSRGVKKAGETPLARGWRNNWSFGMRYRKHHSGFGGEEDSWKNSGNHRL